LGLAQLIFNAGAGANSLTLASGSARIDSTATGGALNTTIAAGAQLSTSRLAQNGLTLQGNSRATLLPAGGTSIVTNLNLAAGATLDIGDNALVVDYTGTSPIATVRQQILSGRGAAGLGATWTGTGITSSAVAQANQTEPESRSVGYAENAVLPLGAYSTFRGQAVDSTAVLIAYTRAGDASLDGLVNDDDVTVVGAAYAPGAANAAWALGDFEYNGFVDDDDVTLLGAFYNPAGVPLTPAIGGVVSGEGWNGEWSSSAPQLEALTSGPNDRHGLAPAVRPGFVVAPDLSRSEGPIPDRAKLPDPVLADRESDETLIDLLAVAVASSNESFAESRLATSRDLRESRDDIWALEWI
jgi:hypothetical protein